MTLAFRLGKIPVQVQPWFFLMALLLGASLRGALLLPWVAIVFASVLVHELGHATAGMTFGLEPRIDLHGMGGTTSWAPTQQPLAPWKRIVVSLAGPGAGFLAAAAVYLGVGRTAFPDSPIGSFVYPQLLFVNVYWGILNLLPMLPLDGGNVMAQALDGLTKGRGERAARIVSIVVAALAAAAAFATRSWWGGFLAITFISTNWRGLKDLAAREHDAPMREALKEAHDALEAKDGARVLELARPVALGSKTPVVKAEALHLLAFGFLLEHRVGDADAAIAALPDGFKPHPSLIAMRASVAGS